MSLADRWSKEEKDEAARIVNDISEELDHGDSREALRKALAIYADFVSDNFQDGLELGRKEGEAIRKVKEVIAEFEREEPGKG